MKYIAIGLGFNLFWLLAVWGQYQYVGILIALLIGCWLFYHRSCPFALIASVIGICGDYVLSQLKVMQFPLPQDPLFAPFNDFIPLWLILLWLGFTSMVWVMREQVQKLPLWGAMMGGSLGGAISYWTGLTLGAVIWPYGELVTFIGIAVVWSLYSGYLLWLLQMMTKREIA
ncbi:DUF2878 family protein [Photobacterium iliopiscarium]|jgi:hypothetical protein|uniref:DUF2878 family protein n=1 Tax=Photobacterium iliopiscarium TaxID=56192 RepID=UPI000D15B9BA|nr:DUF2878 family protein [Photobacterium iliopiscarium]PST96151.1 DUF2878 domain-containing protein [Photobacterium iliopiscarium]PST97556.1 DUF2878 domain-containing protein [Photobacterium iliopiscarium]PSV82855.1 DUF2878 domain-containing protein [Photobacterium iliopiscarium]